MSVVNKARQIMAQAFADQIKWLGIGTDPQLTPTTNEMTDLIQPLVRVPITSTSVVGNALQVTAKITNLPPCEITEMGLFCDRNGPTMLARWLTKPLKPVADNEFTVTWTQQID